MVCPRRMKALLVFVALAMVSGCTCGGCARAPVAAIDAGAPIVEEAAALEEATEPEPSSSDSEPVSDEPEPVDRFAPLSDDEAIARFADDCDFQIKRTLDTDVGEVTSSECDARNFEQNCAPDVCFDALEQCRAECGQPCDACQVECGNSCNACKSTCDGGDCITDCATTRNECRTECLSKVESCREKKCEQESVDCRAEAAARIDEKCPDCDAIKTCFRVAGEDTDCTLQFPNDASECFEWCNPTAGY